MQNYSRYISNLKRTNPDIAHTLSNKLQKITIICLLWVAAISFLEVMWLYEYFASRMNILASVIIWLLLCMIPFIRYKVWKLIHNKTWIGTVTSLKYDRILKATATGGRKAVFINTLEMSVDCGDKLKVVVLPCATAQALYPYEVGDIVCLYKGTKYPVFAVESKSGSQLCPICGTIHKPHERECFWCHHSVIKPSKRKDD